MTNKKSKKSRAPKTTRKSAERRKDVRRQRVAAFEAGLLGKDKLPRQDRHVLVALVMASLVAGLLFVINCDRATNVSAAARLGGDVSLHGWPFVYLERRFESLDAYRDAVRITDWPIPAVAGEIRTMNYLNLLLDIICGGAFVVFSYFLIRRIVLRYEQWKKSWAD